MLGSTVIIHPPLMSGFSFSSNSKLEFPNKGFHGWFLFDGTDEILWAAAIKDLPAGFKQIG